MLALKAVWRVGVVVYHRVPDVADDVWLNGDDMGGG